MVTKTNGGPAFPCSDNQSGYQGMSLRDVFAVFAMNAMLVERGRVPEKLAVNAYEVADAMLKERAK